MITQGPKRVPLYKHRWRMGVATLLLIASWIAYRDRTPALPLDASAVLRSNAIEQQVSLVPGRLGPANGMSKPQTAPARREEARRVAGTTPQWVRVGNNELDYVAKDVTVRYFTPKPLARHVPVGDIYVVHIGEDVTVRYLTPKRAVVPPGVNR
jgi:hypothetical protein